MRKVEVPEGCKLIFRAWRTLPNGKRVYAASYGPKGFPILIRK